MSDIRYPFGRKLNTSSDGRATVEKKTPRVSSFRNSGKANVVADKYVQSILPISKNPDERMNAPMAVAQHVANKSAANVMDNENILQLLPEMELAMQVLISSILSPNNMMSCELNYVCDADDLGDLRAPLIEVVKNFFDNTYKINSVLPSMLEDILFKKGSYPLAVIPETAIDEIINGRKKPNLESVSSEFKDDNLKSFGILGNAVKTKNSKYGFGLESLSDELDGYNPVTKIGNSELVITDNINLLKFPLVHQRLVKERLKNAYQKREITLEHLNKDASKQQLEAEIFGRTKNFGFMPVVPIRTLDDIDRDTVGHPLVLQLPPESVIPVHVPSEPKHHIGYFIALDRHGNPIRALASADYFADMSYNSEAFKDMTTQLLAQTRRNVEGRADNNEVMINETMMMYSEVVERDIRARLMNGIYGDNVEVSKPTEVYRTMLARACSGMQTQLLFIPVQLMTYMAFDYNYYGCGKSLLESTKILSSIRAMMLFANTMAAIKNSTNHVEVMIEFDPKDPDPHKTFEFLTHEYAKGRQSAYPIGASNPLDIINYLQNAGVHFSASGHPMYPQTKLSIEDKQSNRTMVDSELDESLKKRHLSAIGLAPETVDLSMNVDFAQSIVNSNILLAKRALIYQKLLTKDISDFIYKYITNSSILMKRMEETVDNNRKVVVGTRAEKLETPVIIQYFLENVRATLPEPDMTRLENQKTAYELYTETLELVIPAFISSEMFDSSIFGELNTNIETTISIIKAYYQRRWLQNNDVLPELFEITENDKDGNPVLDMLKLHEGHMESISMSLIEFMKKALVNLAKNNKIMEKLAEVTGADPSDTSSDSGGGDEGGSDESGGDEGGGDEFDLGGDEDADVGADEGDAEEEPASEEEPAEEEPAEEPVEEEPADEGEEDK